MKQKKINLIFLIGLTIALIVFFVVTYQMKMMTLNQFLISVGLISLVFVFRLYRILTLKSKDLMIGQDLDDLSEKVIQAIGGKENLVSVSGCVTRVKLQVNDSTVVDPQVIRDLGISGVIKPSNTEVQLITKQHTDSLLAAFSKVIGDHHVSV